jgi:hypothetical protein
MANSRGLIPVRNLTTSFPSKAHIHKISIHKVKANTMANPDSRTMALPILTLRQRVIEV